MKSGIAKVLIIGAMFFGVFGFVKSADACWGIYGAHCFCKISQGALVLTSGQDPNGCYNQQTNRNPGSNCSNYCNGWANGALAAANAKLKSTSACGQQSASVQFAAGTRGYVNTGKTVSVNAGGRLVTRCGAMKMACPNGGCTPAPGQPNCWQVCEGK